MPLLLPQKRHLLWPSVATENGSSVTKEISSVATGETSSVATEEISSEATEEISSVAAGNACSVATEELSSVATEEISSVATEEASSVATEEISSGIFCGHRRSTWTSSPQPLSQVQPEAQTHLRPPPSSVGFWVCVGRMMCESFIFVRTESCIHGVRLPEGWRTQRVLCTGPSHDQPP